MRSPLAAVSLCLAALPVLAAGLVLGIEGLATRHPVAVAPVPRAAIVTDGSRFTAAAASDPSIGVARHPDALPATIDFAARLAALEIEREVWPELTGSVVRAEDGVPIPFAEVVVSPSIDITIAPGMERAFRAGDCAGRTDECGRFRLLTSMNVLVVVRAPGLAPEAVLVEEARQDDPDLLRFALHPALLVGGRVVDADGTPVVGAEVKAIGVRKTGEHRFWGSLCGNPQVEWKTRFGRTDGDGRFAPVECYVGGRVVFDIIADDGSYLLPTLALDDARSGTLDLELRLPRRAWITGTVRGSDGSPASGIRIRVERCFESWSPVDFEPWTDKQGLYSCPLSDPGPYCIRLESVDDDGWSHELVRRDVQLAAAVNTLDFEVPWLAPEADATNDDEEFTADEAPDTGSIAGHIVVGAPVDGADECSVHLLRDGCEVDRTVVEETGDFAFEEVAPGDYTVVALCTGRTQSSRGPFRVENACRLSLPEWTLAPCPMIRGRVVDGGGRAVADARVGIEVLFPREHGRQARSTALASIGATMTDPSGGFTLSHVGDPARIYVSREGSLPTVVALPATASREEIVVTVDGTRRVRGRVVVPGGLPDAPMKVFCRVEVQADRRALIGEDFGPIAQLAEARVEADGTFEFPAITVAGCDLELWVNTSGWNTIGCTVARRRVPAGANDLDVGAWILAAEGR